MKMTTVMGLMVLLILAMYFNEPNSMTPQQINANMSVSVENSTFNIMKTDLAYTSLYDESNINAQNVVRNIGNAIIYPIIVTINTAIPMMVYVAKGQYGQLLAKFGMPLTIVILIIALYLIFWIIFPFTMLFFKWYYFFKEKKRMRLKERERWLD